MKNLVDIINEDHWSIDNNGLKASSVHLKDDAEFILVNTDTKYIRFYTEKALKDDFEEFDMIDMLDDVLKLKVGETFDADGGVSIYMRVSK